MEGATRLRIRVLGEVTASHDGAVLNLGGRRQRAVLTVLLLARGEVVPAEKVADCVWGGDLPENPAGALQSYVSHLRRRLEPDAPARGRAAVIVREGTGYAARLPADAVDAWRFEVLLGRAEAAARPAERAELLREALGLWVGPALVEYADEPWAEAEVARLTELRTLARERLLAARLEAGEAAMLVPELESLVAEQPLREERWRLLVVALYRAHRQADALAALRRARRTLAEELGVDPGPGLRALEAQVLAQSAALAPPVLPRPREAAEGSAPSDPSPARDGLVDRDRELAALREALDLVRSGHHGLVVVEGPAGIGKSRLLEEARRLAAERSVRVLSGRGSQLERAFAFGVVRQLFEPAIARAESPDDLLAGAAASARAVFDVVEGDRADGFAVLHGLYWLAVNLSAAGPLVLSVDDAQWCDAASLRMLGYLARRLVALPVLVLAGVRTGEEPDSEDLLGELVHDPEAMVLRPAPLSPEATAALVERRLGQRPAPLFVAACHQTTSGNPFLLRQLLRSLAADGVRPDASHADLAVAVGSRAASSLVQLRLRRLPDDVAEVARSGAVLGDGSALPPVAALAGQSEARTAECLAVLARAEILRDEQPLAFVHPLVRDAVYHGLPAAERELRHERAATILRGFAASDEQVAAHLLRAPPRGDADVVDLLRRATRAAAERGALESAVTYLRRGLLEPPTGERRREVVLELGLLESGLDGVAGVAHLLEAYRLYDDPRRRAEIAVAAAATQVFASPPGTATAFARAAAGALPADLVDQGQALVALQRISGFLHGLEDGWRTPASEPEGQGPGARMLAATVALQALVEGEDRQRALRMGRFALGEDLLISVDDGLFWVNAAAVLTLADDDLGDFWSRARAAGQARGSLFAALSTSLWEGFGLWRRGRLEEALTSLHAALDQDRMWGGARVGEPFARGFQIWCHLDRGDLAAARRAADSLAPEPLPGEGGRVYRLAVALLRASEGGHEEALTILDAVEGTGGIDIVNPVWNPWRGIRAVALQGLGRHAEAVALVEEEVGLLRRWGAPSFLGRGLCLLGELRGPDGLDQLREAESLLAGSAAALDLARARCALAAHRDVPDAEAFPLLVAASSAARRAGARTLADRARAELDRRGHGSGFSQVGRGMIEAGHDGRQP